MFSCYEVQLDPVAQVGAESDNVVNGFSAETNHSDSGLPSVATIEEILEAVGTPDKGN